MKSKVACVFTEEFKNSFLESCFQETALLHSSYRTVYEKWRGALFITSEVCHPPHTSMRVCTTIDNGFNMLVDGVTRITSVTSDQQLRGFDVDVRAAVLTGALNLSYSLRVLPSYGELQVATRKDECDVGWAPFFILGERERCSANVNTCRSLDSLSTELKSFASGTINWTPWRCCIDYTPAHLNCASCLPALCELSLRPSSTPMYCESGSHHFVALSVHSFPGPDGMAIVFNAKRVSFFEALTGAVSQPFFVNFLCFVFLLCICFAHAIYLCERRVNAKDFPRRYLDGIDDAIWFTVVTFTTVGYGDKVPISPLGRIVAILWMLVGIVLCASRRVRPTDPFSEVPLRFRFTCIYSTLTPSLFRVPTCCHRPVSFRPHRHHVK